MGAAVSKDGDQDERGMIAIRFMTRAEFDAIYDVDAVELQLPRRFGPYAVARHRGTECKPKQDR
jgi:hypothetical protein